MNSKMFLKKQLRSLGINIVQGNYVKKSDVVRLLEKTKVKGNRADKFRKITKTDESHLDESGYVKIADFKSLKKGDTVCIEGNDIFKMMGFDKVHGDVFSIRPNGEGCAIKCKETGATETGDFDDGVWYLKK